MGTKLCTSKANRKYKENQGGKPITNTIGHPRGKYKHSVQITNTNSSNIKTSDDVSIPFYEQLNESHNTDNRQQISIQPLTSNVPTITTPMTINIDNGFVILSDPSIQVNDNSNHNLNVNCDYLNFNKSGNTSINDSSFLFSPTNTVQITNQDKDNNDDDNYYEEVEDDDIYKPPHQEITIGDEIELSIDYNCLHGIVRFIGEIIGKCGIFYGLELNRPKGCDDIKYWIQQSNIKNKLNKIKVNMDLYFSSGDMEGLFVRKSQIGRILSVNYNNPRVSINEEIFIKKYQSRGIIRYIGKPQFKNDENMHETYYGIQLHSNPQTIEEENGTKYQEPHDGTFHDRRYFTNCPNGQGIFCISSDLSEYVIPSRYNLLCHGYFECGINNINIPKGIIKLIKDYSNMITIRLTHIPEPDPIRCGPIESRMIIHRKYQAFDINNNIYGPSITVKKCGGNTQRQECETLISGHYQFIKSQCVDLGDRHIQFVHKTEYEIMKFNNGDIERIFRRIETDNDIPLFKDYKSKRQRWRHDIHHNDTENIDQQQLIKNVSDLYKLSPNEMIKQLKRYNIELYGLTDVF